MSPYNRISLPITSRKINGVLIGRTALHRSPVGPLLTADVLEVQRDCQSAQAMERLPYAIQFSIFKPATRLKSLVLFVTTTASTLTACAAIMRSLAPIKVPFFFITARIVA
jgi:hypothetical protein